MTPEKFAAMCRALPAAVRDTPQDSLHSAVGDIFRQAQADNFASESGPNGNPWPPRKHHYPWPILRKTKRMMHAASRLGSLGNISQSQGRRLKLGVGDSDVPYAKYHQYGTSRLPARTFFYLKAADRAKLLPPVRSHLLNVFNRTRGRIRG